MLRTLVTERVFYFLLLVAIVTALFLHFWRIGLAPRGFVVDECSVAYNAYCIAETGADEYGVKYPVFFRCLDNYQDPVLIYCLAPLVKVFGLTERIARIPTALFNILGALAFGFLVQEYCRNKWLSLIGGALFSFIPWLYPMSRLAFSDGAMLFGMIMGWWLLLMALRKGSCSLGAGAGVAWAFAMYARALGRPMAPLLLLCFGLAFSRSLLTRWKVVLVFGVSYVAALLPMIISSVRFPQSLTTRFEAISVFQNHPSANEALHRVVSRYFEYLGPRFLFLSGDQNLRQNTGFGGELFLFLIPLVLAGLYCLVRSFKARSHYRFLALSFLVYPIIAALTLERMHSGRSINGVLSWLLTAMVGAQWLWERRGPWRKILLITGCAGALEIALYMHDYFGPYQTRNPHALQTELTDVLEYCFAHLDTNQVLYISASTYTPYGAVVNTDLKPQLYVCVLFFGKINPSVYQRGGLPRETVRMYDGHAPKPGMLLGSSDYYFRRPDGGDELIVAPDAMPIPPGAKLIKSIPFSGEYSFAKYLLYTIP